MNHDYTEEDEEDELKVSLFHLLHLLQCNHGSETNQQKLNSYIYRIFVFPIHEHNALRAIFLFYESLSAENKFLISEYC